MTATDLILILSAFFSAACSSAMGLGGGLLLLVIMSLYVPPAILIPLHGSAQLGSNVGRISFFWKDIAFSMALPFMGGSILGALLAGQLVLSIPEAWLQIAMGSMAVFLTWMPSKSTHHDGPPKGKRATLFHTLLGMGTCFVTLLVGVSGPILAPILKRYNVKKETMVGTIAICVGSQHCLKLVTFSMLGFALGQWLPTVAGMFTAGIVGTWAGRKLLHRLPEKIFRIGLSIIITLLGARMLWLGIQQL